MSHEEICLELAKVAQQAFESRRNLEWKATYGLWVGIGAITYFAVEHAGTVSAAGWWCLFVAYIVTGLVWILGWQPYIHWAHKRDKEWKHYYSDRAENRAEEDSKPDPRPKQKADDTLGWCKRFRLRFRSMKDQPSAWTQCVITPVVLVASLVIVSGSSSLPPVTEKQDRICVSGDNVTKIVDRLTK